MKQLLDLATRIASPTLTEEQAAAATKDLHIKLLIHVTTVALPFLKYLTDAIASNWVGASTDAFSVYERTTYFPQPGMVLRGSLYEHTGGPEGRCGPVGGKALVLWCDGTLSEVTTTGSWTRTSKDCSSLERLAREITPQAAAVSWDVESCVTYLADNLKELVEEHFAAQAEARAEGAEKLEAALTSLHDE